VIGQTIAISICGMSSTDNRAVLEDYRAMLEAHSSQGYNFQNLRVVMEVSSSVVLGGS
jgi:hypothetical protein